MGLLDLDKSIIEPITDMVGGMGKTAENLAADRRTTIHQLDMTSKFMLPHLIRPVSFLIILGNELILSWATIFIVFFVDKADSYAVNTLLAALASNTAILTTMVAYYYKSRKEEKITAKTAKSNIVMREMELEAKLESERIVMNEKIKDNKVARKNNKVRLIDRIKARKSK